MHDSDRIALSGNSLFFLDRSNYFRRNIGALANSKKFNFTILALIIVSTISLAFDSPLNDPNGQLTIIVKYFDLVLTCIFTMEAIIKIISFGFLFNGEDSYLRNSWNILDFLIVVAALTSIIYDQD